MSKNEIGSLIDELKNLRLRETRILALIEAANERNERSGGCPSPSSSVNAAFFTRGDRVRVTNRVRRPVNWPSDRRWDEQLARAATVTHVTAVPDRVYFTTDNGIETWRIPTNLRHE